MVASQGSPRGGDVRESRSSLQYLKIETSLGVTVRIAFVSAWSSHIGVEGRLKSERCVDKRDPQKFIVMSW